MVKQNSEKLETRKTIRRRLLPWSRQNIENISQFGDKVRLSIIGWVFWRQMLTEFEVQNINYGEEAGLNRSDNDPVKLTRSSGVTMAHQNCPPVNHNGYTFTSLLCSVNK